MQISWPIELIKYLKSVVSVNLVKIMPIIKDNKTEHSFMFLMITNISAYIQMSCSGFEDINIC